jgi:hypothetical protein
MGVSYAPCPLLGSEASQAASKKWKVEVSKKTAAERAKAGPSLKWGQLKKLAY